MCLKNAAVVADVGCSVSLKSATTGYALIT